MAVIQLGLGAPVRGRLCGLLCGASGLALGAVLLVTPAQAQDAAEQDPEATQVEDILVTGIRSSLRNAQSIKQDSDVFVDAI